MSGIITIGNNCGCCGLEIIKEIGSIATIGNNTGCKCDENIFFDYVFTGFPITGIPNNVMFLNINVNSMVANIDFTSNLPTNLQKGARIIIRKRDISSFKIIYNDGYENYSFINKKGEYIELYYNNITWVI